MSRSTRHFEVLSELTGVGVERVEALVKRGHIRSMTYRGLAYYAFRKDVGRLREGSVVVFSTDEHRVIYGYPAIQRILLLERALPRWFVDKIVVEEKMDGYNVRVTVFGDMVLAITRGGLICPYTTSRIEHLYGSKLRAMCRELDCARLVLAGEVVGMENPYTRFFYPESPRFDYFVFDVFEGDAPSPLRVRDEIVEKYGLRRVPVLLSTRKEDVDGVKRVVEKLELQGREGVVIKDPEYRVPPVKYTTSRANIGDLRVGMRFFFEEGRSFLFSRILREIFKLYEEGVDENRLVRRAAELGAAVLEPALETVRAVDAGKPVYEEFELSFPGMEVYDEFIEYMQELGIDLIVYERRFEEDGWVRVRMAKPKNTWIEVKKILETGISPLD